MPGKDATSQEAPQRGQQIKAHQETLAASKAVANANQQTALAVAISKIEIEEDTDWKCGSDAEEQNAHQRVHF